MNLDRSVRPLEQGKIIFRLPEIKKFKLSNGLDIYFVKKSNLPVIQINFLIESGSKDDPAGKKGLAHLTAALVDEGAGEYDSLQLDNEIEMLGTVFGVSADQDNTMLSMVCLAEHFTRSLELLSKVILEPHFSDSEFERERSKIISKLHQLKDNPGYVASSVFEKLVYRDTAYAYQPFGESNSLKNINNNDVKNFYSSAYSAPNSSIIVVGDIEEDELKERLEKYFGVWNNKIMNMDKVETPSLEETAFYFVHKNDAPQSEIRIGHISTGRNNPEYYAKNLVNTMLGGQFTSRINLNLREDKGYTYGANSNFNYTKHLGYFKVGTSVESRFTGASVSEIIKELNLIRETISEKELNYVKSYLVKRYPSLFETNSKIAKNIANIIIYSLPQNYLDTYIDNIFTTQLEEVKTAAVNNILPDKLVVLAVGNRDEILPQLKEISDSEVIELDDEGRESGNQ